MATIDDLGVKSISNMSDEELYESLRQVRMARRVAASTKPRIVAKKAKVAEKRKAVSEVKTSREDTLELIRMLREDLNESSDS